MCSLLHYSTKPGLLHPVSSVWVWARIPLELPRMLRYIFPPHSQRWVFSTCWEKYLHVSFVTLTRSHPKDFKMFVCSQCEIFKFWGDKKLNYALAGGHWGHFYSTLTFSTKPTVSQKNLPMLKVTKQSQQSFKWQHNRLSMAAVILTQRLIMKSTLHLKSDDNDPFITDTWCPGHS